VRLVVDANILVAELLRERVLVADDWLELFIAARSLEEALHELHKRVRVIAEKTGAAETGLVSLLDLATVAAETSLYTVQTEQYRMLEAEARRRLPRDEDDWHTVALALQLEAAIWTQDKDFLGCGVATWTTETLLRQLG
jgi:predicted nucleic acid-binding protein